MTTWPAKAPDEVLDYKVDWSSRLVDDTITASEWSVILGDVVINSDSFTTTSATVWLSAGTVGVARVKNKITTAGGRVITEVFDLQLAQK